MPDFEIFWGEWGHIELKHELDRSSGTFFLSGGSLRPVVVNMLLITMHKIRTVSSFQCNAFILCIVL